MTRPALGALAHLSFAAAVGIVALGWVLHGSALRSQESARWVAHTLEVIATIDNVSEAAEHAKSTRPAAA